MEENRTEASALDRKKKTALIVFSLVAVTGIIIGYLYVQYKKTHISTDDAFIEADIHTIASKVQGTVRTIHVKENQPVKTGDILFELDPVDYEVRVREALSALDAEKAKLKEIDAKIESAEKQIEELTARANAIKGLNESQEANLQQAESDMKRMESLYKEDIIPMEAYEKAVTGYKSSLAMVKAASEGLKYGLLSVETQRSALKQAEAEKIVRQASVQQKESLLEAARLNLGYTRTFAPSDGYVTKKSIETGNHVHAGQPVMAVVSLDDVHVIANYKETQIERVRAGQRVKIEIDTYPGKVLDGKVDSIMAGTGAVFSLFPPENATGNYVKVVQRIPVKIVFDEDADKDHVLRVGMSVVPTILVEQYK